MFYEMHRTVGMPRTKDEIKATIERLCAFMEKNMHRMRLVIEGSSESDFVAFVNSLYSEIWEELPKNGVLLKLEDDDVKLLLLYSAGGSYFVLRHWLLGNIQKSSREIAEYLYQLLRKPDWEYICIQLGLLPN